MILLCACGHRDRRHFDTEGECASCECDEFELPRVIPVIAQALVSVDGELTDLGRKVLRVERDVVEVTSLGDAEPVFIEAPVIVMDASLRALPEDIPEPIVVHLPDEISLTPPVPDKRPHAVVTPKIKKTRATKSRTAIMRTATAGLPKPVEHDDYVGARIVRNRARHRAVTELTRLHPAEFNNLYEQMLLACRAEYDVTQGAKLRPGARMRGQSATDRIED